MTPSMSAALVATESLGQGLKNRIRRGFVLHIDPDYLLKTYGDVVTGPRVGATICPRYALCIGVLGETTFWALLTTQDGPCKQMIPPEAREGIWAETSQVVSFFSTDQIWILSREMVMEAHLACNKLRAATRWSWVKEDMIKPWPTLPTLYTPHFTKLKEGGWQGQKPEPIIPATPIRLQSRAIAAAAASPAVAQAMAAIPGHAHQPKPAPLPEAPTQVVAAPAPEPSKPETWYDGVQEARAALGLSQMKVAELMAMPFFNNNHLCQIEKGNRLFSQAELERWAVVMNKVGDPFLAAIPVATQSELKARDDMREVFRKREAAKARPKSKDPKAVAVTAPEPIPAPEPAPLPAPPPITKLSPSRSEIVAKAGAILAYHRITDLEALALYQQLEIALNNLLRHDQPLSFLHHK